ncbi:MAG: Bro-N domain-containing protein [Candidatus Marinimicrobia bacterium]|jgi:predicted GNAT superfamily acetyltransferase|nr:Bro-N domain-containing protein [Candidatus Neomarinimicrobiota bacterium]MBT4636053.1 Bro-N domain-containing protein [Candidatus Neomarinimicrobiota bacterium]MBT4764824.1 Bro-N domain-containing protein [bacterium]MBT5759634.1 Bro-N domain-containing protein [Candidatus Neomarinimicrobiota bacterium]MBT6391089.1 Bro-N domain-containing protein [Candidatus Neomarinimicrobiota bacterium]
MKKESKIQLFQEQKVRTHWDDDKDKWYFSIVDVIAILTESKNPKRYWSDLKIKLAEDGSELSENIGQLKMTAEDGKMRMTDVADTEQLLRLIQSIPSPKAEPFKVWLAKVGYERIEETELAFERAMATYLKKGYSLIQFRRNETCINQEIIKNKNSAGVTQKSLAPMELKHTAMHFCYKDFTLTELKHVTAYCKNKYYIPPKLNQPNWANKILKEHLLKGYSLIQFRRNLTFVKYDLNNNVSSVGATLNI